MSDEQLHIAQVTSQNLQHNQNNMTIISLLHVDNKKLLNLQQKTD